MYLYNVIIYKSETNIESICHYLYRTWRCLFVEDAGELRQDTKKSNVKQSFVTLRMLNICNHLILRWAQSFFSPQFVGVYHSTYTNILESIIWIYHIDILIQITPILLATLDVINHANGSITETSLVIQLSWTNLDLIHIVFIWYK